uniref:SelF-HepPS n=1 Tax=Synechococcus elongatus TaxID=32046 RepID=Q9S5E9_SYNEL|nr:farnesyl, geranylgeranyl, geranylfarnesyl, hexaprenyl, heptaprenyl diphosphate synthase (SelF-HepPS) [Synechococcus elongatus]
MEQHYRDTIEQAIARALDRTELPPILDEPVRYALASGGKRLRPLITLLAAEACGSSPADAAPVAAAVEILHNFTLIHDDIMDRSPLRRGRPTVYRAWDDATAILAGDTMMGIAYRLLSEHYPAEVCQHLVAECSSAFVDVCIGQAEDLAFRTMPSVTMDDYLRMIGRKTARLFATAAVAGGIVARAPHDVLAALRTYGTALGMAFQIRDDVLDLFGSPEFGKELGQDLREGKKTFPTLSAAAHATDPNDLATFAAYFAGTPPTDSEEIAQMRERCRRLGALEHAESLIAHYLSTANAALESHLPSTSARDRLCALARATRNRHL